MQTPHTYTHARDTPRVFKRIWLACGINMEFCCRNAQHTALPAARIMSHAIVTLSMHVLPAGPPRSFCEKYLRRLSLFATPAHSLLDISFQWDEGNSEDATFRGEAILSFSVVLNGRFKRDIGITLIFLRFSNSF